MRLVRGYFLDFLRNVQLASYEMRSLMEYFQTPPEGYAIKHAFDQLPPGNLER
jgi:hypothetical protein